MLGVDDGAARTAGSSDGGGGTPSSHCLDLMTAGVRVDGGVAWKQAYLTGDRGYRSSSPSLTKDKSGSREALQM